MVNEVNGFRNTLETGVSLIGIEFRTFPFILACQAQQKIACH